MSDSGEWVSVNIEVATDDLCSVYGCSACPGFVKTEDVLPHVQAALARAREIQGDFAGIGRELARELEYRPL
jgi:hypothetical protein